MNMVEKLLAFYGNLVALIREEEFNVVLAETLIELQKDKGDTGCSLEGFSMRLLHTAHDERHLDEFDFDAKVLDEIVMTVFKDLAPHMRSPEARKIFRDFADLVDLERKDLFVDITGVRRLCHKEGYAVVTMVVNDVAKLRDIITKKDHGVEKIRAV